MTGNEEEIMQPKKMKKPLSKIKLILLAVGVAAACLAGTYAYGNLNNQDATYLTMAAGKGSIVNQVEATGTVTPLHEVDLYFKQQGTLKALTVNAGDTVQAGQVLAVQDDASLRASVEQARSDLLQAKLKLQQSELEYEKLHTAALMQETLHNQGAVSDSDYKQAVRDDKNAAISVEAAKASILTSQAKLIIAEDDLSNAQIAAPFAGVVATVSGEVGQETGNSSDPVVHLISSDLHIVASVNEADIGRVKVGQKVRFTATSLQNKVFSGTVARISPQSTTTNNVKQFQVDIQTDEKTNVSDLLAGISVTAQIIVQEKQNVTTVPTIALTYAQQYVAANGQTGTQQQGTVPAVVLSDNKPSIKWVKTGMTDDQNTEVISGLNSGEQVVVGTKEAGTSTESTTSSTSSSSKSSTQKSNSGAGVGGLGGMAGGPPPN